MSEDRELELLRQIEALVLEREKLRAERDTWHARALAMLWRLPGELTVGELQADSERALAFVPTDAPRA